jgi:hypothetical protein
MSMITRPLIDLLAVGAQNLGDRELHQRLDRNVDGETEVDPELAEAEPRLERADEGKLRECDQARRRWPPT